MISKLNQNLLLGILLLSASDQALTMPNRYGANGVSSAKQISSTVKAQCLGLKQAAKAKILDFLQVNPSDTSKISKSQAWDKARASSLLKENLTNTLPHFSQMDGTAYLFSRLAAGERNIGMLNAANATRPGGGFEGNGTVQEEMLCALTTLYPYLKQAPYPIKDSILSTKNVKPIIYDLYNSYSQQKDPQKDFFTNYVAELSQNTNVFPTMQDINNATGFTVFSVAAHNRASSQQFDQAAFFYDMLEKWRLVFVAAQNLSELISVMPGSGVFSYFPKTQQPDPQYVEANAAAFALAYLAYRPNNLVVTLPRVGSALEGQIQYFFGCANNNPDKNVARARLGQFIAALPGAAPQHVSSQQRHWPKATEQNIRAHRSGIEGYISDWSAVTFQQAEGPAQKSGRSPFWVSKVDPETSSFDISIRDAQTGLCTRYRVTYSTRKNPKLYNFVKNK